ncbi:thylakoid lumenal 16.5 kDa protein, chloroplastic-like [Primulina huaijiensis]|uniref:thylakoid lumenal 16.5 kDa protein, chloroplastic-like n=1 Tax=Primulina huaijiensis TaxID=1492673 RepID=UPI003CC740ED
MGVSITVVAATTLLFSYKGRSEANAAILEAEEGQELLEKVKKDRKKWLDRQGVIQSLDNETVDKNDIPTAKASFVAVASAFKK